VNRGAELKWFWRSDRLHSYEYVKTGKLVESGSWAVEGIGEDFVPDIADMSLVTEAYELMTRKFRGRGRLLRKEGIFAAHQPDARGRRAALLPRAETKEARRQLVPDTGNKISPKCQ